MIETLRCITFPSLFDARLSFRSSVSLFHEVLHQKEHCLLCFNDTECNFSVKDRSSSLSLCCALQVERESKEREALGALPLYQRTLP